MVKLKERSRRNLHLEESVIGNGTKIDKVERYDWKVVDEKGMFEWVDKGKLQVDPSYQRNRVSVERVNSLASAWSWVACNTLAVAMRSNGSLWVMDGQHRYLAAMKRSDIKQLPCMIYETTVKGEAEGFLSINTHRKPLSKLDTINALVMKGDPVAVRVLKVLKESGYRLAASNSDHTCSAAACLLEIFGTNGDIAERVWNLAVLIHKGARIRQDPLFGLFEVESRLRAYDRSESIFDRHNVEALERLGPRAIDESIARVAAYQGARTKKACGMGIVSAINKGRSSRRLPELFG